ncbi:MAG: hypothetical protein MK078_15460 [Crocinitomicaceae bacterium]|nr:hypothetical protein [Crocinitomicaceae bacterium]
MTRKLLLILLSWVLTIGTFGQELDLSGFSEHKVIYHYNDSGKHIGDTANIGKKIGVRLNCCFQDSIHIYLNDSLITNKYYATNPSTSNAGSIILDLPQTQEELILTLVFPETKDYCKIVLANQYRYMTFDIVANRVKWAVIFENYLLSLE